MARWRRSTRSLENSGGKRTREMVRNLYVPTLLLIGIQYRKGILTILLVHVCHSNLNSPKLKMLMVCIILLSQCSCNNCAPLGFVNKLIAMCLAMSPSHFLVANMVPIEIHLMMGDSHALSSDSIDFSVLHRHRDDKIHSNDEGLVSASSKPPVYNYQLITTITLLPKTNNVHFSATDNLQGSQRVQFE